VTLNGGFDVDVDVEAVGVDVDVVVYPESAFLNKGSTITVCGICC
jgi:hypothetical protein